MQKSTTPPLSRYPTLGDHDLKKFESTLRKDTFTKGSSYLANWFLQPLNKSKTPIQLNVFR